MPSKPRTLHARLKAYALTLPEAWEDHPWEDDSVAKVGKKIFAFFGVPDATRMSVKLPSSSELALMLKCCTPTSYGLGRAGWVTVDLTDASCPPYEILQEWLVESFRAVAPKKVAAQLIA